MLTCLRKLGVRLGGVLDLSPPKDYTNQLYSIQKVNSILAAIQNESA
jgi:hypothetical protein